MAVVVVDQVEPERRCADAGCEQPVTQRIFWRWRTTSGVTLVTFWSCAGHQRSIVADFGPDNRTVRVEAVS